MTVSNSRIFHDRGNPPAKSIVTMYVAAFDKDSPMAGADPGFFAGGGGGGQRRPCTAGAFGARADGGSRVDKHQIKVHSVHRIFRAILFVLFFAIVKKFVDKKNWWSRAGGGSRPPPLGSAPEWCFHTRAIQEDKDKTRCWTCAFLWCLSRQVRHVWCERHHSNAQVQHLSCRCLALVWKHHYS